MTAVEEKMEEHTHLFHTLKGIETLNHLQGEITVNGHDLSIIHVVATALKPALKVLISPETYDVLQKNADFLQKLIADGKIIYGVNTGYGGSADVRSNDIGGIQKSLIRHLNAGFGDTLPTNVVRAVMLVRANSLCHGYSGVRPQVVQTLVDLLEHDIVPVVPKRGSVSASGDLMPTSYIAACMMGREDLRVMQRGQERMAMEALKESGIKPIEFQTKEALAVVNSASFASAMGAMLLYDVNMAAVLTQVATAMSVESLKGRIESFHPTIHQCMPHKGQMEAAKNIRHLLKNSQFAIHCLDMNREDTEGVLKQDRYALRTSPQWMAPVLETLKESLRRITVEINSANDNPIVDHKGMDILHGGNFQGISITVAMDQARQSVQLCGKLLFAQMSEILNWNYSDGLPPNLSGCDTRTDFGFKGTDTAMASYCSELDYLTGPLTNHILSAEMHNQAVNSMALVSARMTEQALEILQMMLANILCAQCQAIDLRFLQHHVEFDILELSSKHMLLPQYHRENWPWYEFAFRPQDKFGELYDLHVKNNVTREEFIEMQRGKVQKHIQVLGDAKQRCSQVEPMLGSGTRHVYHFIRCTLDVPFYDGKQTLDQSLEKTYKSIKDRGISEVLQRIFSDRS